MEEKSNNVELLVSHFLARQNEVELLRHLNVSMKLYPVVGCSELMRVVFNKEICKCLLEGTPSVKASLKFEEHYRLYREFNEEDMREGKPSYWMDISTYEDQREIISKGGNTNAQQREFIFLLETSLLIFLDKYYYLKDGKYLYINSKEPISLSETKNITIISSWINEQKERLKLVNSDQPKEEPTPKLNALTTKQQFILLDLLGVLNYLKDEENTKKSDLLAKLIGKDSQNIRNCFTYFGNKNSKENPLYNSENPTAVINLLEKIGFGELAETAREKYKDSLSKKRKEE